MVSLVSCIVISHSLTFSNSDLSISLNMNFIFLQWIQICNQILCRLIQLQSGYRLSNVERFILIQRKYLLISFIHEEHYVFSFWCKNNILYWKFYYHIKLHYSQTGVQRKTVCTKFYYPIKLHYSQTNEVGSALLILFYYPIKLHYSQTQSARHNQNTSFTTL